MENKKQLIRKIEKSIVEVSNKINQLYENPCYVLDVEPTDGLGKESGIVFEYELVNMNSNIDNFLKDNINNYTENYLERYLDALKGYLTILNKKNRVYCDKPVYNGNNAYDSIMNAIGGNASLKNLFIKEMEASMQYINEKNLADNEQYKYILDDFNKIIAEIPKEKQIFDDGIEQSSVINKAMNIYFETTEYLKKLNYINNILKLYCKDRSDVLSFEEASFLSSYFVSKLPKYDFSGVKLVTDEVESKSK